jgi:ABC-type spermidine/putrescine transport system permease subunit II
MVRLEINPKVHALSTAIMLISMTLIILHQRLIRPVGDR